MGKIRYDMPVDILLEFSKNRFLSFWQRFFYFWKILPRYDIWHFNYMEVFFFYPLNLFILKILGKKVVCTFRGSEVRPVEKTGWVNLEKRMRMNFFCFFADKIVLTGPFLVDYVSRFDTIIPYGRDVKTLAALVEGQNKQKIVVLHAPSQSRIKGTEHIKKVFRRLRKFSPQAEFKIIQGIEHQKLLREIAKADIIIDQLLVGWYGGLAAEAMAMGKVVMAFINPSYLQYVDFAADLPLVNTNIWFLERDLKDLLAHPEDLKLRGAESQKFAYKYHDSRKIAKQYLAIYGSCYE